MKFAVTFDIPNDLLAVPFEEHLNESLRAYNTKIGYRVSVHHMRLMTDAKWQEIMDRQCGPTPRSRRGWVRRLTKV